MKCLTAFFPKLWIFFQALWRRRELQQLHDGGPLLGVHHRDGRHPHEPHDRPGHLKHSSKSPSAEYSYHLLEVWQLFRPGPSTSFLRFFTVCCQCVDLDLHRSSCLICQCCWVYFVLSQLYELKAERSSHRLDLNMISHTHKNHRLANFWQNKTSFKLGSTSFSSTHSGCFRSSCGSVVE